MARREQLRLFISPRGEREKARLQRLGYSSSSSAGRFALSLLWSEVRQAAEEIGISPSRLARAGDVRIAAYHWWTEDKGDSLRQAYLRAPDKDRPQMRGYRKPVRSAANTVLIVLERRTASMRFQVGDTQKHLPSYFKQLNREGVPIRGRLRR